MTGRLIGQGSDMGLSNRTIEAGDRLRRIRAEEENRFFVEALDRYFKRGGKVAPPPRKSSVTIDRLDAISRTRPLNAEESHRLEQAIRDERRRKA